MEMKFAGTQIPGNSSSYNVTGLSANTSYYGWAMAVDVSGNESVIVASTPAFLQTLAWIPVPTNPSNFAISESDMPYLGPSTGDTPYSGIQNVPAFLVGVPYTKNIGNAAYPCAFDRGGIHAYGFRENNWPLSPAEPDTEVVYSGLKYDRPTGSVINQVVYKYFPNGSFTISNSWYIWFFTMTPRDEGVAALNA
jgi:hypothetical protein